MRRGWLSTQDTDAGRTANTADVTKHPRHTHHVRLLPSADATARGRTTHLGRGLLYATPILFGFATFVLPLQTGAPE